MAHHKWEIRDGLHTCTRCGLKANGPHPSYEWLDGECGLTIPCDFFGGPDDGIRVYFLEYPAAKKLYTESSIPSMSHEYLRLYEDPPSPRSQNFIYKYVGVVPNPESISKPSTPPAK